MDQKTHKYIGSQMGLLFGRPVCRLVISPQGLNMIEYIFHV